MLALSASFVTEKMDMGSSLIETIADVISIMWNSIGAFLQMVGSYIVWFFDFVGLFSNPVLSLGFSVTMTTTLILVIINIVKGLV